MSLRIGHGFDAHRLVDGRPFVLAGEAIPFERGPLGHSDGDALSHAVCDALLGALALGDLGRHFPDSDPQWSGTASLRFVREVAGMVRARGWEIGNVDATVVVERPKLAPHIERLRGALSEALGIAVDDVSVKAKTSEGMGYTGDGSGIAAHAVAALVREGSR